MDCGTDFRASVQDFLDQASSPANQLTGTRQTRSPLSFRVMP